MRAMVTPLAASLARRFATTATTTNRPIIAASSSHYSPSSAHSERLVLGIETSCDDTAAAVVSESGRVLSERIVSSKELMALYGGVVPDLASKAHADAIDGVVRDALADAGVAPRDLAAVAVTQGPGLSLCLKVGMLKAREVAFQAQRPLIPVHHMEAHALVPRLCALNRDVGAEAFGSDLAFPFVALLVSGGHNLIVLVRGVGDYKILGTTLDDAVGEAFDKVARFLGLDLSGLGGPAIERLAQSGRDDRFDLPRPLRSPHTDKRHLCDFSYAGLKSAVVKKIHEEIGEPTEANATLRADMAASFQRRAIDHLCERTQIGVRWAKEEHPEIRTLVIGGGVASNRKLRSDMAAVGRATNVDVVCPPPALCTDNGVMVAWTGVERLVRGMGLKPAPDSPAPAEGEWVDLRPKWPLGELDVRSFGLKVGKRAEAKRTGKKRARFAYKNLSEETLLEAAERARIAR